MAAPAVPTSKAHKKTASTSTWLFDSVMGWMFAPAGDNTASKAPEPARLVRQVISLPFFDTSDPFI